MWILEKAFEIQIIVSFFTNTGTVYIKGETYECILMVSSNYIEYNTRKKRRIEYYVSSVYTFWKVVFSLRWIFEEVGNSFLLSRLL